MYTTDIWEVSTKLYVWKPLLWHILVNIDWSVLINIVMWPNEVTFTVSVSMLTMQYILSWLVFPIPTFMNCTFYNYFVRHCRCSMAYLLFRLCFKEVLFKVYRVMLTIRRSIIYYVICNEWKLYMLYCFSIITTWNGNRTTSEVFFVFFWLCHCVFSYLFFYISCLCVTVILISIVQLKWFVFTHHFKYFYMYSPLINSFYILC